MPSVDEQVRLLLEGTDTALPEGELAARLKEGRPLRVKLGMDPTAPKVTLGWAVVLRKLRQFQELGHTAVLIVGDFTAQVGDPSGRSDTRRRLTADEVRHYADGVLAGFGRVLLPEPLEIRYNSEWLAGLDMAGVLELTSRVTVAQMLDRDDFSKRYAAGKPISLMEFLYPLLQAMDSVAIDADVELGGSDQLWNLLMGREVMTAYGKTPQSVMTVPLLVGTDGTAKMSQSLGNYIAVDDEPDDMFGKVMSIPDEAMVDYFRLATGLPSAEVATIGDGLADGTVHPGETKRRLAREIVALYSDHAVAAAAEEAFDRVFRRGEAPEEVAEAVLGDADPVWLPGALREAGLVASSSEARRLLGQGAVKVEGEPLGEENVSRAALAGKVVQVGKRRFVRFVD